MFRNKGIWYGVCVALIAVTASACVTPMQAFLAATSGYPHHSGGGFTCGPTQNFCQYTADTTNFTGMNQPNVTFNGSSSKGTYIYGNNYGATGTVNISANSAQNWQVVANVNNPSLGTTNFPDGSIFGYSGVVYNGGSGDYTTLTSGYNLTMPINSSTQAWATTDDWLQPPGQYIQNFSGYEIQIHMDTTLVPGQSACNPASSGPPHYGNNFVEVADSISMDGVLWYLCDGQYDHNSDGSCPTAGNGVYCGELVFIRSTTGSRGGEYSATSTSGTLDLKGFFQWLETNNVGCQLTVTGLPCKTYPYMAVGSSLYTLTNGWEIPTTSGTSETFTHSQWTISATGAPTVPTTTPTYTSSTTGTAGSHQCTFHFTGDSNATAGYDGYLYFSGGGPAGGGVHLSSGTGAQTYTVTGNSSGESANLQLSSVNNGGDGPYWSGPFQSCTTG